ncbi:hypothetical protein MMC14_004803 [Varicellaria rhodocarpa]|nr:hypothetical protein [Varicellaria rhodocarpa]
MSGTPWRDIPFDLSINAYIPGSFSTPANQGVTHSPESAPPSLYPPLPSTPLPSPPPASFPFVPAGPSRRRHRHRHRIPAPSLLCVAAARRGGFEVPGDLNEIVPPTPIGIGDIRVASVEEGGRPLGPGEYWINHSMSKLVVVSIGFTVISEQVEQKTGIHYSSVVRRAKRKPNPPILYRWVMHRGTCDYCRKKHAVCDRSLLRCGNCTKSGQAVYRFGRRGLPVELKGVTGEELLQEPVKVEAETSASPLSSIAPEWVNEDDDDE